MHNRNRKDLNLISSLNPIQVDVLYLNDYLDAFLIDFVEKEANASKRMHAHMCYSCKDVLMDQVQRLELTTVYGCLGPNFLADKGHNNDQVSKLVCD